MPVRSPSFHSPSYVSPLVHLNFPSRRNSRAPVRAGPPERGTAGRRRPTRRPGFLRRCRTRIARARTIIRARLAESRPRNGGATRRPPVQRAPFGSRQSGVRIRAVGRPRAAACRRPSRRRLGDDCLSRPEPGPLQTAEAAPLSGMRERERGGWGGGGR